MPDNHTAYVSFGSNMGDRETNCRRGVEALSRTRGVAVMKRSPLYQTSPVDFLDQGWFVNGALKLKTALTPFELLRALKEIERFVGREKPLVRFGPRVLDMDIVLYGAEVVHSPELVIPHPRMHKRSFVLQPLCDIDADIIHPVFGKSIRYLLDHLHDDSQKVWSFPCSDSS
ncbi:MAG: 2-amino-4-hydroxy-6-hydroxymethyldihydropteridine diphosphokinase [Thermodesulfobacteriota bacterium]